MYKKIISHLLYIPFCGLGRINRGNAWLEKRIKIFNQFVVPSLTSQTNLHFTLWFSWRPEDKENQIVKNFYEQLKMLDRMSIVFTYEGLCFYDDKYEDKEAKERLLNNLRRTLPELKTHTDHADYVYLTIQPSDDMYNVFVVNDIQSTFSARRAVGYNKGYIANYHTKEIAEYNPETNPPFYTMMFEKEEFQDYKKHFEIVKDIKSHEYVNNALPLDYFENRGFVVGTHGQNISTDWTIPYKGRILSKEEAERVWIMTGNYFTENLKMKVAKRLLLRKVYNILPCKKLLKRIYYWYAR